MLHRCCRAVCSLKLLQALPGGHIFITRALLQKLKNEAQLAGDAA
jgi:predicted Zn-dependent protease